ncbi:hypothetical protein D0T84_14525 [Dysgonomonas sp. 521]|uniref:hypothetical protein n=1 Tax=Dysgonomonas sp. 521 TaxID=2302932 RepID=UPI0013D22E24|nr:hypothetical protein [Dysgonomonas sp. 521]NDV96118.1 hypothetical protein [Dysgonomonas sp. 521]
MKQFIKNSLNLIVFLIKLIFSGSFRNPIKKESLDTIAVLANGPSLKDVIPNILINEEFKNVDFVVLNFFAFDDIFFKIKPKYYCLADPMFFHENHRIKDVRKLFSILENKVNWNLSIFIPSPFYNKFVSFSQLKNTNINIIKVNNLVYRGFPSLRNFFYKKGAAIPSINTVLILALYVSIQMGSKSIRLYGADHDLFKHVSVNDNNQLCSIDSHFYDEKLTPLKPLRRNRDDKIWKISDFLESMYLMFKSHDQLASFAIYSNIKIINCTKGSMIDSYERDCNISDLL